jgi:hypothetical protein
VPQFADGDSFRTATVPLRLKLHQQVQQPVDVVIVHMTEHNQFQAMASITYALQRRSQVLMIDCFWTSVDEDVPWTGRRAMLQHQAVALFSLNHVQVKHGSKSQQKLLWVGHTLPFRPKNSRPAAAPGE